MNNQEAFNKVCTHLKAQGRKSVYPGTEKSCAYHLEDGRACAVGCLLPLEQRKALVDYNPGIEILRESYPEHPEFEPARRTLKGIDWDLLADLQDAHDYSSTDQFWLDAKAKLIDIARRYRLEEPQELKE